MKFHQPAYSITLIIGLLLITCFQSYCQDVIIGTGIGTGSEHYLRTSDQNKTENYPTHKASFIIEFSPFYSHLFFVSGADYCMNELGESISVPLLARVTLGTKILFYAEGGAYYNLNLYDAQDQYTPYNDIGLRAGLGLEYRFSKRWRAQLAYSYLYGFTKAYSEEILLPLHLVQVEEYIRKNRGVTASFKYRF